MIKQRIRYIISKIITPIAYLFPIKKNRVIFKSYDLKYNCNTKYMCEYLNKNHKNEFELIYVTKNNNNNEQFREKGIKFCKVESLKYHYYMFTSRFIFVNHAYPQYLPKKKNQIAIFTDHGVVLFKNLQFSEELDDFFHEQYKKIDIFLFSSKLDAKNGKKKFGCTEEKVLYSGIPRVSPFFNPTFNSCCKKIVKETLGIEQNKKLILYAPTFRANHEKKFLEDDFSKIISACEKRFGGEFVILNRDHNFTLLDDGKKYESNQKIYECNIIEDSQELVGACDVIISDYSSIIWDASFSKNPCFLYIYDYEEYTKTWSFFTDINKWPFPKAENIDDFCNLILEYDEQEYNKKIKEFYDYIGLYENGTACEQIYNYMIANK